MAKNHQVSVRWKIKKTLRVGSGDTFSFLVNPSTLFSQDSFPRKTSIQKHTWGVCFSSASPPRFLFIWALTCLTPLLFDEEAGDQVDHQHRGCCLWSWHFSLGFGFLGCLVLPVVGRMNSWTVLPWKGWTGAPKAVVMKRRSYHSIQRFASPFFFGQGCRPAFFFCVCPTPK